MPSTLDLVSGANRGSTIGAGSMGLSRRYLEELRAGYNHVPAQAAGSGSPPVFRLSAPDSGAGIFPGRPYYFAPGPKVTIPTRPPLTPPSPSTAAPVAVQAKPRTGSIPGVGKASESPPAGSKAAQEQAEKEAAARAARPAGGSTGVLELAAAAVVVFGFLFRKG